VDTSVDDPREAEADDKFALTELSQRIINANKSVKAKSKFLSEFAKNGKLEIKDLISSKDGQL
jgi:hypothetical protein